MENVKGFFDSFKEFIWDIIGYLIPGTYLIIILSVVLNPKYFVSFDLGEQTKDFYPFVFIIIAYILGYVVYGFGVLLENIWGKKYYTFKIQRKTAERTIFEDATKILSAELLKKQVSRTYTKEQFRDVRSIVMGFIPESDQKIYTFTFRSELSNHTGNISFVVSVFGFLSFVLQCTGFNVFKIDLPYLLLYSTLLGSYFLLRLTRDKFYGFSMSAPLSIFISKLTK